MSLERGRCVISIADWDTNPANNTLKPGINWSEGMLPGDVNGSARQMMADVAVYRNSLTAAGATYALLAGAAFTGNISAPSLNADGTASFYVSSGNAVLQADTNDYLVYFRASNFWRFHVGGIGIFDINSSGIIVTGGITASGGALFGGEIVGPSFKIDASAYWSMPGANPTLNFDAGDYYYFDRATNAYAWVIASSIKMTLDSNGAYVTGTFFSTGNSTSASHISTGESYSQTNKRLTRIDEFASGSNANGKYYYQPCGPNLLLIQKGRNTTGWSGEPSVAITFPIPYSAAPNIEDITLTPGIAFSTNEDIWLQVITSTLSSTGFSVRLQGTGGALQLDSFGWRCEAVA